MTVLDFKAELRREEALRQAEGIPADVRRSIRARVERTVGGRPGTARPLGNRGWFLTAGFAVAVAAGLALVTLRAPTRLGEFELARESADLAARVESGLVEIERGDATLVDAASGVTIETSGPVALRRDAEGVRVVRGHLDISVKHRPPGATPVTIFVSHGAIEVMGTAFTVAQGASGGSVVLREGSIRFRSAGQAAITLRPGEELRWPLSTSALGSLPAPTAAATPIPAPSTSGLPVASSSSALPATKPSVRSTEELLNYVEELRSRHQFEAAARELARGLGSQPSSARERLSFELGSLFTHQIGDARRACAHWARHERQFHGGVYRDQVASAQRALACPTP
jgi:transmembrane sensor